MSEVHLLDDDIHIPDHFHVSAIKLKKETHFCSHVLFCKTCQDVPGQMILSSFHDAIAIAFGEDTIPRNWP